MKKKLIRTLLLVNKFLIKPVASSLAMAAAMSVMFTLATSCEDFFKSVYCITLFAIYSALIVKMVWLYYQGAEK